MPSSNLRITEVRIRRIKMRLKEPFVIASQSIVECDHLICIVNTDSGVSGVGAVATIPAFMGETGETIEAAMIYLSDGMKGKDPFGIDRIVQQFDEQLPGNNSAKAALDLALHDLMGRALGLPVYRLLGGAVRHRIPLAWIIGLKSVKETVDEAVRKYQGGFKVIKVKIGHDDGEDLEKIRLIRNELGADALIRVDANCAYTADGGLRILSKLEQFDLELIEQPCRQADITGMRRLRQALQTPILADESVMSPEDALRIVMEEAADIINIKVGKVGGIAKARRIAAIADAGGLPIVMSGNLELGPGIAASAHVAASLKNARYATDIFVGGHKHFDDTILEGWGEEGMTIRVPEGHGLGVTVRPEFMPEAS
ncbi:hypothetical protein JQ628_05765 [Bradyrhizobium lablabi]|uniref:mandelate racemase/muconate lactonizing enzyme family protein n=1 Tax=Bradyrhizobium lablabi TaxID=722472 RepID=UPI001BAB21BA|nr:enolase C-terminal domain-like protein [Bradyrhizobium lablabi]MBR1121014.1 hypothetical protein [Bradyrhizobium lablabi]